MRIYIISFMGSLALLSACGKSAPDRSAELEQLLASESYEEILARTELYLDEGDESPLVFFTRGAALINGQNADVPAKRAFADAIALDATLDSRIATVWRAAAIADAEAGWHDRAARRMREAFRHDNDIDLAPLAGAVGDLLYRHEEDFEKAYLVYSRLVLKDDAPERDQQLWTFRYGHCLDRLGDIDGALAVYNGYFSKWPDEQQIMRYVSWRYQFIHIDQAELALREARWDDALELAQGAFIEDWNMELQQRARVLAGRAHEGLTEYEQALDFYNQVVEDGESFGAEPLEQARERIDALAKLGIH